MHKVLFLGDLYRPGQKENIIRTCNSFSPVLKEIGIDYEIHASKHNEQVTNRETFAFWEQSLVGNGFKSELSALDLSGYLIIGFEISNVDKNYLNKQGYDWISLSIHPLRFMDDLYFSLETSMNIDLARNSVSNGFIDMSVKALRQRYNPNFKKQETRKSLCILGQRQDDKSVFINNTFKKLQDYTEKLDCLVNDFDEVLYKPHPYNDDQLADEYIEERYHTKRLNEDDIYKVFCLEEISSFCAISSSLLYEAKSFGLESIFLDNSPLKYSQPVSYRLLVEDKAFWSKIFQTRISFNLGNLSRALPDNYLRKVFAKWSYRTEEDLLLSEINKSQDLRLKHEVHLLKQLNKENVSFLNDRISDLENQNELLGELFNKFKVQADEDAKSALELIKESKELLKQAISKHNNLSSELNHIKTRKLWNIVNPFFILEDRFLSLLKERKRYLVYHNIRVPWYKHLFRAFAVLYYKSDKAWHTHLYRCIYSLMGNEKYSVNNNVKKEISDNNVLIENKNKSLDLSKDGLKVLQFTNYKLEDYNQGGKIRSYEIRNALLEFGFDVKTLSFGLGHCDQLINYHLEVDKSSFFSEVEDGTISDWAISDYILKRKTLWLNLCKFVRKLNPDILILEQPFLWSLVKKFHESGILNNSCLVVNSTHNIEFKLKEYIYKGVFNSTLAGEYASTVQSLEEDALKYSDLTLCVSKNDFNYFKSLNKKAQIAIFPNGSNICSYSESETWEKRFKGTRNNWVFVASWHQPNIDGIRRLIDGGLDSFDSKQTKLWIFGSVVHPISEFISNHSKRSSVIQLIGERSDSEIAGAIKSSTGIILPIWQGGGTNLKTAQALLSGKFIISTSYAFRGYEQFISANRLEIVDEESSFANQMLLEVYSNDIVKRSGVENLKWCNIMSDLPSLLSQHYFKKNIGYKLDKVYFEITSVYKSLALCSGITRVVSKLAKNFYLFNKDVCFVVFDSNLKKFLEIDIQTMILKRPGVSFEQNSTFLSFCNTWDYENYEIGLEEISKKCSNVIYFIHDLIPCKMPHAFGPGLSEKYHNWLTLIFKNGTQFLTNSEFSKRDIIEFIKKHNLGQNQKINVIRLGDCIGSHNFIYKKNNREPYLLSVGTLEFRKNHQVLLDSYRILLEDPSFSVPQLVIAGKQGWMDNHILHQIKHDRLLQSKVKVFHNLTDEELHELYENCLFTLYPSVCEGWGLPVAESFAHGKLCIISSESSMSEICPNTTIEIDALDPYKWSMEIRELILNKEKLKSIETLIEKNYKRQNWTNTYSDIISRISQSCETLCN